MSNNVAAIQEMLTAITDIGVTVMQILKDGKVDVSDFGALMGLVSKQVDFAQAIKDAPQIPDNIKALSEDDLKVLVQSAFDAFHTIKNTNAPAAAETPAVETQL
jgi:hypothetical protein